MKKNNRKKTKQKTKKKHPKLRIAKLLTRLGLFMAIGVVIALGMAYYKQQYEISHDLAVIGNGTPTAVQIHDTNCRLCQQLRRNVEGVDGEFGDRIQFRIADLATISGLRLAQEHQACRYLDKDFGTSKSPKSTRQRDNCCALTVLLSSRLRIAHAQQAARALLHHNDINDSTAFRMPTLHPLWRKARRVCYERPTPIRV